MGGAEMSNKKSTQRRMTVEEAAREMKDRSFTFNIATSGAVFDSDNCYIIACGKLHGEAGKLEEVYLLDADCDAKNGGRPYILARCSNDAVSLSRITWLDGQIILGKLGQEWARLAQEVSA